MQSDDLVACDGCGAVYLKRAVGDKVRCPTCELTTRGTTSVPKLGRVHKWWSEVPSDE